MVADLTGSDSGPRSKFAFSNWDKKIISISKNKINIEFKSDDSYEFRGFSANIYFTPIIPNMECEPWLNITKKIFRSPNYPQTYTISNKCYWLITVDHDSHITLNFIEFYVRLSIKCDFLLLLNTLPISISNPDGS